MTVIGTGGTGDGCASPYAESPARLVALSDGIYAIAMTLLVLDVSVPEGLDAAAFRYEMGQVWPKLGAYALSFAVLGAFWRDQRQILHQVRRADVLTVRLTLASLGAAALLPFPTALLSEYGGEQPLAVSSYVATIAVISLLHLALFTSIWRRAGLQARPIPDRLGWTTVTEQGAVAVLCGASVVIAFAVSPRVALGTWLLSLPLKHAIRWRSRTRRASGTA
ncbi:MULTISPECIES: TMEM175 family protein [unclassified Streptomyces]|uniref:TMEM175 family protein n=1 Tax=unclassified Streptomyces TaxID=2593676 RepID=UPI00287FF458|nr:TMEM175 family protein [Streptomyces sp. I6]